MNKQLTFQEKYNAIGSANASEFEGMFITAVKTTGIFCRPTCRARKPKAENVAFYASPQIALAHGFRPCKLCRPTHTGDKMVIHTTRFNTPIGTMVACATEQGVCLLEFADRQDLDATLANLCQQHHGVILPGDNPHLQQAQSQLSEYFAGVRQQFSVAIDALGTEFQGAVWAGLQTIAYGTTCTYKQQAIALDKPKAFRAVASANGSNRIAILIPCHRVVGSDGRLSGFRWGLTRKQWLLDLERNHPKS